MTAHRAASAQLGADELAAARARLAEQQRGLVDALVAGASAPVGVAPDRVRATAAALKRKRWGEVSRAWPRLAYSLGSDGLDLFAEWAASQPKRSSFADGFAFAEWLEAAGRLPVVAATELADVRPRWHSPGPDRATPRPRRWVGVARAGAQSADGPVTRIALGRATRYRVVRSSGPSFGHQ